MKIKQKIALFLINTFMCVAILFITCYCMSGWGMLVQAVCYGVAGVGFLVGLVSFLVDKDAILKSVFIVIICAIVIIGAVAIMSAVGRLEQYETDEEKIDAIEAMLRDTGGWGMVVYFLIQVLQVVILPLPALVCYVPGAIIWGPLYATLIASAGVIVGSLICYVIGKYFGHRAVVWIAGKETVDKYTPMLAKRGKIIFVLMQILPFFPDDILCMLAGLTCMNFPFFLSVIVLVRPVVIAVYCYFGGGSVIPYDQPWGIAVWAAIFVVSISVAIVWFKYQDKIEGWLVEKFSLKRKNKPAGQFDAATVENKESSAKVQDIAGVNEDTAESENVKANSRQDSDNKKY